MIQKNYYILAFQEQKQVYILYATKKDKIVLPLPISNDSEVAGVNDQESARKIQDRLNLMSKEEYSDIFLNFLWS